MKKLLVRTLSQTETEIEKLDIEEILALAEDEDISLAGCDTIEEMKTCLIQGINRNKLRDDTQNLWNEQRQLKLKADNQHKRNELARIFSSTKAGLSAAFTYLNDILTQNGSSTDLSRDLIHHKQQLQSGQCNVLFAGETNAGKSSLLNLLLGEEILPKSILSCTSGICKLSFSPVYTVIVVHRSGQEEERTFSDATGTRDFLADTVATQKERSRELGPSFKEVHILLPARILMSGITIIDSPGFGENEAMDAVVRDFVLHNDVAAFIYVIKTDNSGGVQDDRLIRFLKSILNIKVDNSEKSQYFNPKAALFVCNRWDLISDADKPRVRDNAVTRLRSVWPGLEDNQVCFMSTRAGLRSEGADFLYQALDEVFQLARQWVVTNAFCWLKHYVRECAYCLRMIVNQTNKDCGDLQRRLASAIKKLSSFNNEARDVINRLKLDLECDAEVFRENLKTYLASVEMQRELSQWEVEDIPDCHTYKDCGSSWNKEMAIIERIVNILDESEVTKEFITDFVEDKMNYSMSKLGRDMDTIKSDLNNSVKSFRSSVSSTDAEGFGLSDIGELVLKRVGGHVAKPSTRGAVSFVDLSRTVVRQAAKAVSIMRRFLIRTPSMSEMNPFTLMTHKAQTIARIISKDDEITRNLVSRYTSEMEREIDKIHLSVPQFVTSLERLISEIISLNSDTQTKKRDIQKTMEYLEQQKELLRGFGDLHVKDIASDDIVMCLDDPRMKSSSLVKVDIDDDRPEYLSRVLWTRFQKGILSIDEVQENLTIRYYINQPADNHLYREIAKLRCLEHFSVAKFLGMTRAESQSAFIFLGELSTARVYLRRAISDNRCPYSLRDAVPNLLEGLVEGLEYIHKEGLVHMELNADTIMIDTSGEVKLVGMCLPRLGKFPLEKDSIEAGDFTCLSPEVLDGDVYTKAADIYSFGLLVAEVVLPERPFWSQRTWTLRRFMSSVNPAAMLDIPEAGYSKPLHELLHGCLIPEPYQRLSINKIRELVQELKTDDLYQRLGLTRQMNSRRPSALWSDPMLRESDRPRI